MNATARTFAIITFLIVRGRGHGPGHRGWKVENQLEFMEVTATGKTATTKNTSIIRSPKVPITSETLHDLPDPLLSTYANVPVHERIT
ncbi:hypothetical protein F5141DRAFT_1137028 [Pisolithus sp. B1]|nr:hypothetical protein F5141DRAFT_1137028 [Pisolithus sp. B1]